MFRRSYSIYKEAICTIDGLIVAIQYSGNLDGMKNVQIIFHENVFLSNVQCMVYDNKWASWANYPIKGALHGSSSLKVTMFCDKLHSMKNYSYNLH